MGARIRRVTVATVKLWGRDVGAVAWDSERSLGRFEYDPEFLRSALDIAPLTMPRGRACSRSPSSTAPPSTGCRACWRIRCPIASATR